MSDIPKRTFADTINALRRGALAVDLDAALQRLVKEAESSGKGGSLTLTIKIKPSKGGPMEIVDDFKVTPPKPEKGITLLYATPDGHLQRSDPRQGELEGLTVIEKATTEVRVVNKA